MATVPASISGSPRGIQNTLSGFVVESETFTETPQQEDFDDQQGARADERVFDTRTDLELTIYGANAEADAANIGTAHASGGKVFTYAGSNWKIDTIKEAGTYNSRRRWTINAHKFDNFPAQGTSQGTGGNS